jgi:hypothetical protein
MPFLDRARFFAAALLFSSGAGPALSEELAEQQRIEIIQDGHVVAGIETAEHVHEFALARKPFELRVSRHAAGRNDTNLGDALFEVCASSDRSIFGGIETGMSVGAMPCLNGAAVMARAPEETKEAVELMLSKGNGNNSFDDSTVSSTPTSSVLHISRITAFAVMGQTCFGPSERRRCIDKTQPIPFDGHDVYLLLFTDLNGDRVANAGEFSRVKLRF